MPASDSGSSRFSRAVSAGRDRPLKTNPIRARLNPSPRDNRGETARPLRTHPVDGVDGAQEVEQRGIHAAEARRSHPFARIDGQVSRGR